MVSELGSTILWRSDVDRVFAAPDSGLDEIQRLAPAFTPICWRRSGSSTGIALSARAIVSEQ